ncbi:MAG: methionyl-tRNA formyltransferase [Candidatus Gracilibacteria bacterium]|nr:methionyl-tRNA formyltransferase [Candidatus Gracilibacteria bacterium]MDD4530337.1 methionyl-tRNA formyltransferase [Candidatus Gracilibacteria bacterium]
MLKIGFFGTPHLAKQILKDLFENEKFQIKFVVTGPDKPIGRGLEMKSSAVKEFASKNGIKIFQPEKIRKNVEFLETIKNIECDYYIAVAYGKILPEELLSFPKKMPINVHFSILPKYRGSSPIQSCLINGDPETGVTIMKMSAGMDEGDIIDILKIKTDKFETSDSLFDKFANISGKFMIETIEKYENGLLKLIPQDNEKATYCQKIEKENGLANFNQSAEILFNLWKGLTSWPGIYSFFNSKKIIFEECDFSLENANGKIGEVIKIGEKIGIKCEKGVLILKKVKIEGKKGQEIKNFINGYRDIIGYKFN